MSHSVDEWMVAARRYESDLEAELARTIDRINEHIQGVKSIRERIPLALKELTAALLPTLSQEAVNQAATWCSYMSLRQNSPVAAAAAEKDRLETRNTAIVALPRYANRKALRDPVVGSLTLRLAEQKEHQAPLQAFCERAAHERLTHLLDNGYGTDTYDVDWWRLSYYCDWKAGDEILEQLQESEVFETFGAFLEKFTVVRDAKRTLDSEIDSLESEIAAGVALRTELAENTETLSNLPEIFLQRARNRITSYLTDCGHEVFGERLANAPEVQSLAKRWAGLQRQAVYLDALRREKLNAFEERISNELRKIRRKMVKYRRPKRRSTRFSAASFQRQFKDRSRKYAKHWKRYDATYRSVANFEQYDRGGLGDDCLWWDVFTDGRIDGSYVHEVTVFRRNNPSYRYSRPFDDSAAAATVAQALPLGRDPGGFLDPS